MLTPNAGGATTSVAPPPAVRFDSPPERAHSWGTSSEGSSHEDCRRPGRAAGYSDAAVRATVALADADAQAGAGAGGERRGGDRAGGGVRVGRAAGGGECDRGEPEAAAGGAGPDADR